MPSVPENVVLHGDCLDVLKTLPDASVDAVVTDPPYGLGTREPSVEEVIAYLQGSALDTGGDFMGKNWQIPSVGIWKEVFRVLKPGGHLVAFAGTRTWDVMSIGIRAAGFESRDTIHCSFGPVNAFAWKHGQGFPKSLNVGKAIDKMSGAEREVVGPYVTPEGGQPLTTYNNWQSDALTEGTQGRRQPMVTAPTTPEAKKWDGWGTALKPSWEPAVLFRKPIAESTVAEQVLKTGTGAINIDGCRIHSGPSVGGSISGSTALGQGSGWNAHNNRTTGIDRSMSNGRWPANVVLVHGDGCRQVGTKKTKAPTINRFTDGMKPFGDGAGHEFESVQTGDENGQEDVAVYECAEGCPVAELDRQSGTLTSGKVEPHHMRNSTSQPSKGGFGGGFGDAPLTGFGDTGGASRFFATFEPDAPFQYVAKASTAEKNEGLEGFVAKASHGMGEQAISTRSNRRCRACGLVKFGSAFCQCEEPDWEETEGSRSANHHSTVKPVTLMSYLVRLVTPPGGLVLDPFAGSGSTLVAAAQEGVRFLGIEREEEYVRIAQARAAYALGVAQAKFSQRAAFDLMSELPHE